METSGWKFLKIFAISWDHLRQANKDFGRMREIKRSWAAQLMSLLKVEVEVVGLRPDQDIESKESMILVSNHISYTDIALVYKTYPNCSFVSRSQVKLWPVIGPGAAKAETIFVDRESKESRNSVKQQILKSLQESKKQVVIFPSGTTKIGPTEFWRKGAFEIAKEGGFKVQLFRIKYIPVETVAYVGDDFFPTHVMRLFKVPVVHARIEFGESFYVNDILQDLARAKAWCEEEFEWQPKR